MLQSLFGEGPLAQQATAVATPGGTGAIYQAVVNALEPGQSLLTSNYYWGPYRAITAHAGRGIETFNMFGEDGAFDVEALAAGMERQASTQGRVLVVLNFPCHNPTGYSLSPEEWSRVSDVVCRIGKQVPVTVAALTAVVAILMVINVPYHSFKGFDLHGRVPFVAILAVVLVFGLVTVDPPKILLLASLAYAFSGPIAQLRRWRS